MPASAYSNELMKHLSEQRLALACLARDYDGDFVPIPHQEIAACLFRAQACFRVRLIPKTDHERFRFGGNREPQFMRTLMIGHRGNSHFARCGYWSTIARAAP